MMKRVNKYQKLAKIGEGTYGVVYKAKEISSKEICALKKIRLKPEEEGIPSTAIREISLLKEINHKNVVRLLDVIHTSTKLTLVFEYCDNDLKRILEERQGKGLPQELVKLYLYQLLKGTNYIHKYKILHRDLKPQNLLINTNGLLKICDFGLARGFGVPIKTYTNEVVTLWYRPPDILLGSKIYLTSVDIWSIGCIFAEMIIGRPLFVGKSENDQLDKIFQVLGTPDEEEHSWVKECPEWNNGDNFKNYSPQDFFSLYPDFDPVAYDLLSKMIIFDPDSRISAEDALKHKYFDDIQQKLIEIYK